MINRLSYKQKKEWFKFIVERDSYKCLYCSQTFTDTNPAEYEHLNNNENDNRPENLVLSHHSCNVKKKYNTDFQILAAEKLKENERSTFACERTLADTGTTDEISSQQKINKMNRQITIQWLEEHMMLEKEITLRDAVNAIVNLCNQMNDSGSQSAVYRYIDTSCNPYNGKYTLARNLQGKTIIRKRAEN